MDDLSNIKNAEKLSNRNPFTVPENYFNEFPSRLDNRIREQNKINGRQRYIHVWKKYAAAAVILVIAIIAGNSVFRNSSYNSDKRLHTQISNMIESELYSINEQTIVEAFEASPDNSEASGIKQDEAIDYLLNSDINEDELVNEL
jgi:hypothetical protein